MKKTICRFELFPFLRKIVEFARLFAYDCYEVKYVNSKAESRYGFCVTRVVVLFSGGITIYLFVVDADEPLKPIHVDSRIQVVTAWKLEKTTFRGWQGYNIALNRLRTNMLKRNDEILFDFQTENSEQFDYKIEPYLEVGEDKDWGCYYQLQF